MRSKKFLQAEQVPLVWDVPGLVAGVDEAGRGPLAGPVFAAAVILEPLIQGASGMRVVRPVFLRAVADRVQAAGALLLLPAAAAC